MKMWYRYTFFYYAFKTLYPYLFNFSLLSWKIISIVAIFTRNVASATWYSVSRIWFGWFDWPFLYLSAARPEFSRTTYSVLRNSKLYPPIKSLQILRNYFIANLMLKSKSNKILDTIIIFWYPLNSINIRLQTCSWSYVSG